MIPIIDDIMWLALTIYQEAAGEPDIGKRAVGFAIMNRVKDDRWPGTVSDVVLQAWQFSAWNTESVTRRRLDTIRADDPAWLACYKEACVAYFGILDDPTNGANSYLNIEVVRQSTGKLPRWYQEQKVTAVHGAHTFLKL